MSDEKAISLPSTAAQLRAKALGDTSGAKAPRRIELAGETFFVFPPTIGQDSDISSRAQKVVAIPGTKTAEVKVNTGLKKAWGVVHLVRTLDGAPIFTEADVAAILASPRGSVMDQLAEAAGEVLGVDEEDVGKN